MKIFSDFLAKNCKKAKFAKNVKIFIEIIENLRRFLKNPLITSNYGNLLPSILVKYHF